MQQSLLRKCSGISQVVVGLREGHVRQKKEKEEERWQEEVIMSPYIPLQPRFIFNTKKKMSYN